MSTKTGSCACGNITFVLTGEPIAVGICHCKDCQKQTSTAFSIVTLVPQAALDLTGTLASYQTQSVNGEHVTRSFCPKCGSAVRTDSAGTRAQGITIVKAGLFDDTSWLKPGLQIFCDSAQSWVPAMNDIARFPGMPPG
jgi:hypothetical protein